MEDSSSINKSSASRGRRTETQAQTQTQTQTQEESGWTSYFEDFLSTQQRNLELDHDDDHHHTATSCLVSDAASLVCGGSSPMFSKKLNFVKKTRTREISYDDSLEDTASSPVNSPKVGSLKEMGFNQRKTDDNTESSLGKEGGCDNYLEQKTGDEREMVFEGNNNNCTDLRKRGLCLVPMSMLINYLT